MKNSVIVFVLLLFVIKGLAQSESGDHYKKAKIYLSDHRILKARDVKVNQVTAQFVDSKNNEEIVLPLKNISLIKVPKGNHLLLGTALGTATLSLSALVIDLDTDPLGQPRKKEAGFYLAMAGSGAALGALIGVLAPKWKSIPLNTKSLGFRMPINLDIHAQTNSLNLKITMRL